jgi:hypothetical protein
VSLSEVFLGVIAIATLVMAAIQIGATVAVGRFARDAQKALASVQEDVKPLVPGVGSCRGDQDHTLIATPGRKIDQLVPSDPAHRRDIDGDRSRR